MCVKRVIEDIDCNDSKIISQLFEFYEDDLSKNTKENQEYTHKIVNVEEKFYESLTDMQKKQFEELAELKGLNAGVSIKNTFIFAFKLAVNLILECKIKI